MARVIEGSPMLSATMPPSIKGSTPSGRYSYRGVTEEIADWLATQPRGTRKQIAGLLQMTDSQFAHRMRGVQSRFTIEMLGVIADFAGAPTGWPWIPWRVAAAIDDVIRGRR